MSTDHSSPGSMAPEAVSSLRWLEIHGRRDEKFSPRLAEKRLKDRTKMPGCEPCCSNLQPLFSHERVQETSRKWPASDSNLQRPRTTICFSSGFSGCQWLCCSPFAPTAHSSSKLPVITHAEPKTIEMQRLCHALNCLRHPPLIHRPGSQRGAR